MRLNDAESERLTANQAGQIDQIRMVKWQAEGRRDRDLAAVVELALRASTLSEDLVSQVSWEGLSSCSQIRISIIRIHKLEVTRPSASITSHPTAAELLTLRGQHGTVKSVA
jgi:hypothetical protein